MDIIGKRFLVDFGVAKATLLFLSDTSLSFNITEKGGEDVNITETVALTLTELRPKLYLATWQEQSGTTVVQVHDHENGIIYSNWTTPQGEFNNLQGTINKL